MSWPVDHLRDQASIPRRIWFSLAPRKVCSPAHRERELSRRIGEGDLESQRQLVPEIFEADPGQVEAIDLMQPLLKRLGIEVTPAGPRSIAIHAFPSLLVSRRVEATPFVSELLEKAAAATAVCSRID